MSEDSKNENGLIIQINDLVWQKVFHWIEKSPVEVSGLGKVVFDDKTGVFNVIDAYLVEQENGPAETEMKADAIAKLMAETFREPGRLCWWWHSHVNMPAFWSGTDHATIRDLGGAGWVIATVFNKKREYRSAYYQAAPNKMLIDNIHTETLQVLSADLVKAWDDEYDNKVKEKKSYYGWQGHKGNYYDSYQQDWIERQKQRQLPARTEGKPNIYGGIDLGDDDSDVEMDEKIREYYHKYYTARGEQPPAQAEGNAVETKPEDSPTVDDIVAVAGQSLAEEIEIAEPSSDDGAEGSFSSYEEFLEKAEEALSSVDPRDGDDIEADALDMIRRSIGFDTHGED